MKFSVVHLSVWFCSWIWGIALTPSVDCLANTVEEDCGPDNQIRVSIRLYFVDPVTLLLFSSISFFSVDVVPFFSFPFPLLLLIAANSNFMGAISSLIFHDQIGFIVIIIVISVSSLVSCFICSSLSLSSTLVFPLLSGALESLCFYAWRPGLVPVGGDCGFPCSLHICFLSRPLPWMDKPRPRRRGWGANSRKNKKASWGPSPPPARAKCQTRALITAQRLLCLLSLASSLSDFSQQPLSQKRILPTLCMRS